MKVRLPGAKGRLLRCPGVEVIVSRVKRLLLFVGIPLLELYVLSLVEGHIGLMNTLGVVVATGLMGAAVMKRQGAEVWRSAQVKMARGEIPAQEILGGIMVLMGGALMITPGIITDGVGLLLMIPAVRSLFIPSWSRKWFPVPFGDRDKGVYDIGSS